MKPVVDDVRIQEIKELTTPAALLDTLPGSESTAQVADTARRGIHRILRGADDRLLQP